MAYVITDSCIKDLLCVDACPTDCIHPKKDEPAFEAASSNCSSFIEFQRPAYSSRTSSVCGAKSRGRCRESPRPASGSNW